MSALPVLTWLTRLGLLGALLAVSAAVIVFFSRQRAGALGGKMSAPKAAWLFWALAVWFIVCPLLALEPALPMHQRATFGVFALNMWIRGVIELYMLYGPKNWRPPYGISHDVFSLALLLGCWALWPEAEVAYTLTAWGVFGAMSLGVIAFSLVLETAYAIVFFKIIEGKTTGDDGVWFADAEDERWRRVNLVTAVFNVPIYVWLIALILTSWGAFA